MGLLLIVEAQKGLHEEIMFHYIYCDRLWLRHETRNLDFMSCWANMTDMPEGGRG